MSDMKGQIHVVNSLGMRISVDVESDQDAFAKMRMLGRSGWGPLEVPAGGFRLPLALHEKFDWSLIGAFPLTVKNSDNDDESGVMFQGQFFKRRQFEEQTRGKKLPASTKYSRGAKPTDDPKIVEKGDGDIGYVTLITFRGNGKSIPQFEIPNSSTQGRNESAPPLRGEQLADAQTREPVPADDLLPERQITTIRAMIERGRFPETAVAAIVRDITRGRTRDYTKARPSEGAELMKRLAHAGKVS